MVYNSEYYKQYRIDNADKIKERHKQYRIDNADKIKEQNKIKIVCECGIELNKVKLKQHQTRNIHKQNMEELNLYGRLLTNKERYMSEANVLKRKEQQKKYYETDKNKERILCMCGKKILKSTTNEHNKTQYHIISIKNKNEELNKTIGIYSGLSK